MYRKSLQATKIRTQSALQRLWRGAEIFRRAYLEQYAGGGGDRPERGNGSNGDPAQGDPEAHAQNNGGQADEEDGVIEIDTSDEEDWAIIVEPKPDHQDQMVGDVEGLVEAKPHREKHRRLTPAESARLAAQTRRM